MANKLNVRFQEQYHTLEWWLENDPVLLEGEPAFVVVEVVQDGTANYVPSILQKVGDGKSKFSELDFNYAKAADVYEWAKKTSLSYNDLPTMLTTKVATLESEVCGSITNTELEEILK